MNTFESERKVTNRGVYDDREIRAMVEKLQQDEQNRAENYCLLEQILQQDTRGIKKWLLRKITTLASTHMRATQEATNEIKMAASNTLVTLACCHFNFVMRQLQCHIGLLAEPDEFIFITLGNLASAYALKCIPFVEMTLNAMRFMLELVKHSRTTRAFCGVLEKWSRAIKVYFSNWEKCPFLRISASEFCRHMFPIYCYVTTKWLSCEDLELKQAIIRAIGPMMSLLLHKEEYKEQIFENLPWILSQYQENIDVLHVTKTLNQILEVCEERKITPPKETFNAVCHALHSQICSHVTQLSTENREELFHSIFLLARSSPDDLVAFLNLQLESENIHVAFFDLIRAIADADLKLPAPQELLVRLLVVASSPYGREECGCAALELLRALHPNIHAAVGEVWVVEIPSLLRDIAGNTEDSLDYTQWERSLLQFLRTSLELIDDSVWISQLCTELNRQMVSYAGPSKEKSFLYKALGIALAACQDVVYVKSQIDTFLNTIDDMEASEGQGVSSIFPLVAKSHLDLILNAVQEFGAAMKKIKISKFIGRLKDYHPGKIGKTRRTLMLIYSSVAAKAPRDQLLSRVEADITGNILQQYRTSCQVLGITVKKKDMDLKLTLIQCVTEISCAILETGDSQEFEYSYKQELLGYMLDFIKEEPLDSLASPVRHKAILAIGHLSKLKPSLSFEKNRELLDLSFRSLFPLPPLARMKEEGETENDALNIQSLYVQSLEALGKLMEALLEEEPTADWFQEMFQLLETWIRSQKEWERERAFQASIQMLTAFRETVKSATQETFAQFGTLLGQLAPYSCDSLVTSREWVVDCVSCLLSIQGQPMNLGSAEEELRCVRESLTTPDPEVLLQASSRMARVVSEYFPSEQAIDFLDGTLDAMGSASPTCATAAGLWMTIILKECGDAVLDEVPDILSRIYYHMHIIQEDSLRSFMGEAASILTHHHPEAAVSSLLCKPLPMDRDTTELWRSLGGDPWLATQVLQILINKIKTPTSQESNIATETEIDGNLAAAEPLSATCAIIEVLSTLQSSEPVKELLPHLLPVLLQQVSQTLGQKMPTSTRSKDEPTMGSRRRLQKAPQLTEGNPCRLSIQALGAVLLKGGNESLEGENGILLEDLNTHHEGVCLLVRRLLSSGITTEIIQSLLPWANSPSANLTVTSTAFLAELMSDPILREMKLLKAALNLLEERSRDSNIRVRQMAVRGLGNLTSGAPKKVKKYKKNIVVVLMRALNDHPEIIGESMEALVKILQELKGNIGSFFIDLTQQIRTHFDNEDDALRLSAFVLFGILARLAKRWWKADFSDQVRWSWVALLLHLQDPNPAVSRECRMTFHLCAPFSGLKSIQSTIKKHLEGTAALNLELLQEDICKHLAREKAELLMNMYKVTIMYFHSSWEEIRAAAAKLAGIIVKHTAMDNMKWLYLEHLLLALQILQNDPSPTVRLVATEIINDIFRG